MNCPRCGTGLFHRDDLDLCPGCDGIWFDRGELEALAKSARPTDEEKMTLGQIQRDLQSLPKPNPSDNVQYIKCPACGEMMTRRMFGRRSGVLIDQCREHGIWLDAGEREAIIAFAEKGGMRVTEREESAERNAEAGRLQQNRMDRAAMQGRRVARYMGWASMF